MLNLGCGSQYHLDWINVDFNPSSQEIISHDLTKPLPFTDDSFDIVYHSHVLEHFGRVEGVQFLGECYRVCKKGGVVRVVVPDLEVIVRLYLYYLEETMKGKLGADIRYDWMMLELYDQAVRTGTGGETHRFLTKQKHPFEVTEFLKSRFGNFNQQYNKPKLCTTTRMINNIYKPKKIYNIFKRYIVKKAC